MPSKPSFRRTLLLLPLLSILSCAKVAPHTALDAASSAPLDRDLTRLEQEVQSRNTLTAFAQATLQVGGRKELFDAALLVRAPDQLFIQILDELGQERAHLVADGTGVIFWDAQKNQERRFSQDPEALKKALRLPLSVEDLIAQLLMRFPSAKTLHWEAPSLAPGSGKNYLAWREDDAVGITEDPLRLLFYEARSPSGNRRYRVDYRMPEIVWTFTRPSAVLTLRFQSYDLEKPVSAERFRLDSPQKGPAVE